MFKPDRGYNYQTWNETHFLLLQSTMGLMYEDLSLCLELLKKGGSLLQDAGYFSG